MSFSAIIPFSRSPEHLVRTFFHTPYTAQARFLESGGPDQTGKNFSSKMQIFDFFRKVFLFAKISPRAKKIGQTLRGNQNFC